MTIKYDKYEVTITEDGVKFYNFVGGVLLIVISAVLLWLRQFAVEGSQADNYLLGGGSFGIIVGFVALIYSFRYKEREFSFTPTVLHIKDKNSGTKILDLSKEVITGVEKHVIFQEDNSDNPKVSEITYDINHKGDHITFRYKSSHTNPLQESEVLDRYITDNYDVNVTIDQQFLGSK